MTFVSYAQNHEDVMLARVFRGLDAGFYIDVGAQDPRIDSVTKAFYEQGWRGINMEPIPFWYQKLCQDRPRDINLRLAAGAAERVVEFYEIANTGLSTSSAEFAQRHQAQGYELIARKVQVQTLDAICAELGVEVVHFLKVDAEGAEADVLRGIDLVSLRPWVILVEATEPNSPVSTHAEWESLLVDRGYVFVYNDGLNRFYLASEHSALSDAFATPANVYDDFVLRQLVDHQNHEEGLRKHIAAVEDLSQLRAESIERLDRIVVEKDGTLADAHALLTQAQAEVSRLDEAVAEREASLSELRGALAEREASLSELRGALAEREASLSELRGALAEREASLSELRGALAEREASLSELRGALAEREASLSELRGALAEREASLSELRGALAEREASLSELRGALAEREASLSELRGALAEREASLSELRGALAEREASLSALQGALAEREASLSALRGALAEREASLSALRGVLAEREASIGLLSGLVAEHEAELQTRKARIAALAARLRGSEQAVAGLSRSLLDSQASRLAAEAGWGAALVEHEATLATLARAQDDFKEITASRSWRLTSPLRRIMTMAVAARGYCVRALRGLVPTRGPGIAAPEKHKAIDDGRDVVDSIESPSPPPRALPISEDAEKILARYPILDQARTNEGAQ